MKRIDIRMLNLFYKKKSVNLVDLSLLKVAMNSQQLTSVTCFAFCKFKLAIEIERIS